MRKLAYLFMAAILLPALPSLAADDIKTTPDCAYCGMDREKFSSTRMLIEYEGEPGVGTCSIHCAAVDLAQSIKKTIKGIKVSNYGNGELIDAESAVWVIGADLPGVMSGKSRLAFADKDAASDFQKRKGGEIVDFDTAIDDTYDEMWRDIKMIREKRAKMKMMKHGK